MLQGSRLGWLAAFRDVRRVLRRSVAIKVLRPELAAAIGRDRFLREIELAAGLQHPHILGLLDSGDVEGMLYYIMPLVEGESLRQLIVRERTLPHGPAVRLASQVAEALDYAHRRGVIHRDIKPENVLLQDGQAAVADFGIALALGTGDEGRERLTATGFSLGTPAYMSPEQVTGMRDLDGRSDQYSLGCVLFEMLTGAPPFQGPTAQAVMVKHVTEAAPSLAGPIGAAIARALAKDPAARFATTAEFAAALTGTPTAAVALVPMATIVVLPFEDASPNPDRPRRVRASESPGLGPAYLSPPRPSDTFDQPFRTSHRGQCRSMPPLSPRPSRIVIRSCASWAPGGWPPSTLPATSDTTATSRSRCSIPSWPPSSARNGS